MAGAEDVVSRLGGHARLAELLTQVSRHTVRASVDAGRLVRVTRGVYTLPDLPSQLQTAAAARGVLSHVTAARHWGLAHVRAPTLVDLTVPPGSRPRVPAGVRLHWSRLAPEDVRDGATTPLRTALDCATVLPFVEALAVADNVLAERFVQPERLVAAAEASPARGRARRVRVARAADGRAENAFESALRAIVLLRGIGGFEPQLAVRLPRFTAHVDLGDSRRRIALEADSFAHHGTRQALTRDCERYDELAACGWTVLRFAWEQVMFRPDWVGDVVERACAQRQPGPITTHSSLLGG